MKIENDPIVDSKGNTLSSYLLSGELPPVTFTNKYRICDLHEDLGTLQPNLEFLDDDGEWTKSGIVKGTVSKSLIGRYRVAL